MIGQTISHYRILLKLGEGGMGIVYKAEDVKLKRTVALKFLPSQENENRERFLREAQAAAALNQPNICTIFEIDEERGFLAMELVDGLSVKDKIAERPLKLGEALDFAIQIAAGLQAAHDKGVTHRDIKPANILVTEHGQVKITDFGLAALTDRTRITKTGTSMGTPAYMSPEQARGEPLDRRTDLWSLGVVLYEMLTGRLPFSGETEQAVIYGIVHSDPEPPTALRSGLPVEIDRVIGKALAKNPAERYQNAADLQVDLRRSANPSRRLGGVAASQRRWAPWVAAATAGLFTAVTLSVFLFGPPRSASSSASGTQPVTRFAIDLSPTDQFPIDSALPGFLSIAPDGRIFYAMRRDGTVQLYARGLGELEAVPIPGTEGAMMPFISPDGTWIGFASKGELRRVPVSGGPAQTLTATVGPRGASWGPDDTIVFAPTWNSALFRISARGGNAEQITTLNVPEGETAHRDPHVLPDGHGVLFTVVGKQGSRIAVVSKSGAHRIVTEGGRPFYLSPGLLVLSRGQTLFAAPFDVGKGELTGPPVPILQGITPEAFAIGPDGTLAYVPAASGTRKLVWVDRKGSARPLSDDRRVFNHPRLSPDGKKVAVETGDRSIWLYEIGGGAPSRLTEKPVASRPIWTPDGKSITFAGWTNGRATLYSVPADGSAEPKPMLDAPGAAEEAEFPLHWSTDGGILAFSKARPGTLRNVWMLPVGGKPKPFLDTPADERPAMFSPDGRWLVYAVRQSNREEEVCVQPYPGPGPKSVISTGGGAEPVWSPTGREIFYRSLDGTRMMTVAVQANSSLTASVPKLLFEGKYYVHPGGFYPTYDVTRNGQFFLMIELQYQAAANRLIVVVNWVKELQRRIPAKRGDARP